MHLNFRGLLVHYDHCTETAGVSETLTCAIQSIRRLFVATDPASSLDMPHAAHLQLQLAR